MTRRVPSALQHKDAIGLTELSRASPPVRRINQWKLLHLRVFSRYLCAILFAFCSHTYLHYGVYVLYWCMCICMYTHGGLPYYIYRMKILPALSFWRAEKIWNLYSIVSLLLASTQKEIIFSFMFFLDSTDASFFYYTSNHAFAQKKHICFI